MSHRSKPSMTKVRDCWGGRKEPPCRHWLGLSSILGRIKYDLVCALTCLCGSFMENIPLPPCPEVFCGAVWHTGPHQCMRPSAPAALNNFPHLWKSRMKLCIVWNIACGSKALTTVESKTTPINYIFYMGTGLTCLCWSGGLACQRWIMLCNC